MGQAHRKPPLSRRRPTSSLLFRAPRPPRGGLEPGVRPGAGSEGGIREHQFHLHCLAPGQGQGRPDLGRGQKARRLKEGPSAPPHPLVPHPRFTGGAPRPLPRSCWIPRCRSLCTSDSQARRSARGPRGPGSRAPGSSHPPGFSAGRGALAHRHLPYRGDAKVMVVVDLFMIGYMTGPASPAPILIVRPRWPVARGPRVRAATAQAALLGGAEAPQAAPPLPQP